MFFSVQHDDAEAISHQLRLEYTSATCDACGTTVAVAEVCPCGHWRGTVDPLVEQRRAALAGLPELLAEAVVSSRPAELQEALDILGSWTEQFFALLNGLLGTPDADSDALRAHLGGLTRLRAEMSAAQPLRPWIALWRPIQQAANHFSTMAERYLATAIVPTRVAALEGERSAQAALDEAAGAAQLASDRVARWGMELTVRLPDSVVQSARRAYEVTGATDVVDLDVRGGHIFARITGRTTTHRGIGAALALETAHVADAADEDRFWEGAATAYRSFSANPDAFRHIMAETAWTEALAESRRDLYDALVATEVLLRGLRSGEERKEVDAVLRLGARLTEGIGRRFIGLLLAVSRPERATRLLRGDSGDIIKQARQGELSALTFGFDAAIRNADAHRDYRVRTDGVDFTSRTREYDSLSNDELVDRVLGALESAVMITVALDCALVEARLPLPDRLADVALIDRLTILLAIGGMTDPTVNTKGHVLALRGKAAGAVAPKPLPLVAMLTPYVPAEVATARLTIDGRDGRRLTAQGPLAPFRREHNNMDERDAAVVETLAKWKINGQPVASRTYVRRWASIVAAGSVGADLDAAEPSLNALIAMARRVADRDLEEALRGQLELVRSRTTGVAPPQSAKRRQLRLASWLRTPPGNLNDGSGGSPTTPGLTLA